MKNSGTNKHDLVGVVSWGDGCAAVGIVIMMLVIMLLVIMMLVIMLLVIMMLVTIVHEVGGDKDDEGGDYDRHNLVAVNTIKSVLDW